MILDLRAGSSHWVLLLALMFAGLFATIQAAPVKGLPPTPWRIEAGVLKRGEQDWYVARQTTTIPLRIDPSFFFGAVVRLPRNSVSRCHAVIYQPKSKKLSVFEVRDGIFQPYKAETVIDKKGMQEIKIRPMSCQQRFMIRVQFNQGDRPGPYIFYLYVNKRLAGRVIFKVVPPK